MNLALVPELLYRLGKCRDEETDKRDLASLRVDVAKQTANSRFSDCSTDP